MKVARATLNGRTVVESVEMAISVLDRMRGLLGREGMAPGSGMLLLPCNAIHTFLMKFDIDTIFLDKSCKVVKIERGIQPGRMVFGGPGAWSVLEVQSGWLAEGALKQGDALVIE